MVRQGHIFTLVTPVNERASEHKDWLREGGMEQRRWEGGGLPCSSVTSPCSHETGPPGVWETAEKRKSIKDVTVPHTEKLKQWHRKDKGEREKKTDRNKQGVPVADAVVYSQPTSKPKPISLLRTSDWGDKWIGRVLKNQLLAQLLSVATNRTLNLLSGHEQVDCGHMYLSRQV